jgi:alpha-L-fucosidase
MFQRTIHWRLPAKTGNTVRMNRFFSRQRSVWIAAALLCAGALSAADTNSNSAPSPARPSRRRPPRQNATAAAEHSDIGVGTESATEHTQHPDAQWYPDAGLGLFIHWGIASVRAINISWPMIPGRALARTRVTDPKERERIIRESDYNLTGKPNDITPNEYWTMAKDFNPQKYNPDKWMKAAAAAGFKYVVLTTRHHEGFALWPSAYGNFDTKNFMGGRDLLVDYVKACRKYHLKVGFYYSPPNWYFEKDYKDFMYSGGHKNNPEFPALDADLKPRTNRPSPEDLARHQAAYDAMVRGQVQELLTRYGKIDLLWFDGRPPTPHGRDSITLDEIRKLQPGIVVNPRLHGHGDFITYERTLGTDKPVTGWAEFCNTWTAYWPHVDNAPFRAPGFVLGQLARSHSLGVNYLLGVGPTKDGEFCEGIYQNMAIVAGWMKRNGAAINGTKPLPASESASVPAVMSDSTRYLFATRDFRANGSFPEDLLPATDQTLTLKGAGEPKHVRVLGNGAALQFTYADNVIHIELPAAKRTPLVDVIAVDLK